MWVVIILSFLELFATIAVLYATGKFTLTTSKRINFTNDRLNRVERQLDKLNCAAHYVYDEKCTCTMHSEYPPYPTHITPDDSANSGGTDTSHGVA